MKEAEIIALSALTFLAGEPDRFRHFLQQTGLKHADFKTDSARPEFLAGVLDYLLSNEALLVQFAENDDLESQFIARMRHELPGARQP